MDTNPLLAQIRVCTTHLANVENERADLMAQARAVGIPMVAIAQAAGMTVDGVYKLLRRKGRLQRVG